jgi:lipopolysaccharide export system protein LptA
MRICLSFLLLLSVCPIAPGGEFKRGARGTNNLVIHADGGFVFSNTMVIYREHVRVTNEPTSLACELLTVHFETNETHSARIERLVAETNIVVTQPEGRATGDLAVYTATNDLLVLTGFGEVQTESGSYGNAMVQTPQGTLMARQVFFDRKSNRMWAPGRTLMILQGDAFGQQGVSLLGTNALRLPGKKPASTNTPSLK